MNKGRKKKHYIYFSHLHSSQSVFKHTSSLLIMETNTDTLQALYVMRLGTEI